MNKCISKEIGSIKKVLSEMDNASVVGEKLDEGMSALKKDLKISWADMVKKEISESVKVVNQEVKTVLNENSEENERLNNVILFQRKEDNAINKDKEMVIKMIRDMTNGEVKENDVKLIRRIGKKGGENHRPVIIVFHDHAKKLTLLKNLAKIKTLEGDLKNIVIRHDMTRDQKDEYNKLRIEAKNKQDNDSERFLYRVRGAVGKWRIVRFKKTE